VATAEAEQDLDAAAADDDTARQPPRATNSVPRSPPQNRRLLLTRRWDGRRAASHRNRWRTDADGRINGRAGASPAGRAVVMPGYRKDPSAFLSDLKGTTGRPFGNNLLRHFGCSFRDFVPHSLITMTPIPLFGTLLRG